MTSKSKSVTSTDAIYKSVREIIETARKNTYRAVNFAMVQAYWNIGKVIFEEEQKGKDRADYGKELVKSLSIILNKHYGKGFDQSNLWHMRPFYLKFQFSTQCVEN